MKYYQRRLPLQKLTYAYNTRSLPHSELIDEQSRQKILQFKKDSFILGVNAALTDRKGIDQIIKALRKLANYKLIIIGDGKSKIPLENLSVNEQVSERVLFLGYQKDAYRFLPFYDLFILPSRNEGFGLTLLESALYKKNVVCSRIPIFEELCPQGEVTFFELENISSLVKAIQTASQSPDLGNKLYQRYIQSFSPNVFYKRYNQIYNNL